MEQFVGTWGLYPFFADSKKDYVYPDDLDAFTKIQPYGKVFHCVDEKEGYLTLEYMDVAYRVKPGLYHVVPKPMFLIGDEVREMARPDHIGTVYHIEWHYNKEEPMYFLEIDGRKKSHRYFVNELESSSDLKKKPE